jgi:hypothetical protein
MVSRHSSTDKVGAATGADGTEFDWCSHAGYERAFRLRTGGYVLGQARKTEGRGSVGATNRQLRW